MTVHVVGNESGTRTAISSDSDSDSDPEVEAWASQLLERGTPPRLGRRGARGVRRRRHAPLTTAGPQLDPLARSAGRRSCPAARGSWAPLAAVGHDVDEAYTCIVHRSVELRSGVRGSAVIASR